MSVEAVEPFGGMGEDELLKVLGGESLGVSGMDHEQAMQLANAAYGRDDYGRAVELWEYVSGMEDAPEEFKFSAAQSAGEVRALLDTMRAIRERSAQDSAGVGASAAAGQGISEGADVAIGN